jgi:YidC/Oxa1 family membrane protein insertase
MDKQGLIGMGLLIALLIGYLTYNQRQQAKFVETQRQDSIAKAIKNPPKLPVIDSNIVKDTSKIVKGDTNTAAAKGIVSVLENKVMKISFDSKGGQPVSVELKNYKTAIGKKPLQVFRKEDNFVLDLNYKTTANTILHSKDILFTENKTNNSITYTSNNGPSISYTLGDSSYMVDIKINGNNTVDPNSAMQYNWASTAPLTEYDPVAELQYNAVAYYEPKDGTDYTKITGDESKTFKDGLKWLCFKQHYFNTSLVSKDKDFVSAEVKAAPTNDTSLNTVTKISAMVQLAKGQDANVQLFVGPNDYHLLQTYNNKLENMIPLEYTSWLSFIRYLNKWIIIPIFDMLSKVISNYGIVILLLTLIVRLLMSPITYKSYVSGAKMKALKPELDELRAKYGDNQQEMGVKQMELYRSSGVSPFGGCLPALAQLPIFFALLSFFPNEVRLRQQKFLWADDLSTFDSIINLPFNIPLLGNHISLWTILFVITSLILALYSMNTTPTDNSNPALKYMPFIMPVIFLGIFNKLPASLTFYYFVSNVITIILQFVIQNYIIKPEKLRAQIEANKLKGPSTNKFMEKLQQMQKENEARMKKK